MTDPAGRMVLLYGPPASGKDTITRALERRCGRFRQFPRLKCGGGRTTGYRMVTAAQVEAVRAGGDVLWENQRYGAVYLVDRPYLTQMLDDGLVPVIHLGQIEAVRAIAAAIPHVTTLTVALECPRSVCLTRLEARGTDDVAERLAAYDATPPLVGADLTINTSITPPEDSAARIRHAVWPRDED